MSMCLCLQVDVRLRKQRINLLSYAFHVEIKHRSFLTSKLNFRGLRSCNMATQSYFSDLPGLETETKLRI